MIRSLGSLAIEYWRVKSYIPSRMRSETERILRITGPTDSDIDRIESLGLAIGLERSEIRAATGLPMDNMRNGTERRIALLDRVICRVVCLIILFKVIIVILFAATTPGGIYAQGTRYGSISPNDFGTD